MGNLPCAGTNDPKTYAQNKVFLCYKQGSSMLYFLIKPNKSLANSKRNTNYVHTNCYENNMKSTVKYVYRYSNRQIYYHIKYIFKASTLRKLNSVHSTLGSYQIIFFFKCYTSRTDCNMILYCYVNLTLPSISIQHIYYSKSFTSMLSGTVQETISMK